MGGYREEDEMGWRWRGVDGWMDRGEWIHCDERMYSKRWRGVWYLVFGIRFSASLTHPTQPILPYPTLPYPTLPFDKYPITHESPSPP